MLSSIDSSLSATLYIKKNTDISISAKPADASAIGEKPPICYGCPEPTIKATPGDAVKAEEIKKPVPAPPRLDPALFTQMLKYFEAGDMRADVDHNGNINVNDFMAFLNLYAQGINPFEQPQDPPICYGPPAPKVDDKKTTDNTDTTEEKQIGENLQGPPICYGPPAPKMAEGKVLDAKVTAIAEEAEKLDPPVLYAPKEPKVKIAKLTEKDIEKAILEKAVPDLSWLQFKKKYSFEHTDPSLFKDKKLLDMLG